MKKSKDVLENIVRLLALREVDWIEETRIAENHPSRRIALYAIGKHLQSLLDDLDAAKLTETQDEEQQQSMKVGGTD